MDFGSNLKHNYPKNLYLLLHLMWNIKQDNSTLSLTDQQIQIYFYQYNIKLYQNSEMITRVLGRLQPFLFTKITLRFSSYDDFKNKNKGDKGLFSKKKEKDQPKISEEPKKFEKPKENPFIPRKFFHKKQQNQTKDPPHLKQKHHKETGGKHEAVKQNKPTPFIGTQRQRKNQQLVKQSIFLRKQAEKVVEKNQELIIPRTQKKFQQPELKQNEIIIELANQQFYIKLSEDSTVLLNLFDQKKWQSLSSLISNYNSLNTQQQITKQLHPLFINRNPTLYLQWINSTNKNISALPDKIVKNLFYTLLDNNQFQNLKQYINLLQDRNIKISYQILDTLFGQIDKNAPLSLLKSYIPPRVQIGINILNLIKKNTVSLTINKQDILQRFSDGYIPGSWLTDMWYVAKERHLCMTQFITIFQNLIIKHHSHISMAETHSNRLFYDVIENYYFGSHITTDKIYKLCVHSFQMSDYQYFLQQLRNRLIGYRIRTGLSPFPNAKNLQIELNQAINSSEYEKAVFYFLLSVYAQQTEPYSIFQDNPSLLKIMKGDERFVDTINDGLFSMDRENLQSEQIQLMTAQQAYKMLKGQNSEQENEQNNQQNIKTKTQDIQTLQKSNDNDQILKDRRGKKDEQELQEEAEVDQSQGYTEQDKFVNKYLMGEALNSPNLTIKVFSESEQSDQNNKNNEHKGANNQQNSSESSQDSSESQVSSEQEIAPQLISDYTQLGFKFTKQEYKNLSKFGSLKENDYQRGPYDQVTNRQSKIFRQFIEDENIQRNKKNQNSEQDRTQSEQSEQSQPKDEMYDKDQVNLFQQLPQFHRTNMRIEAQQEQNYYRRQLYKVIINSEQPLDVVKAAIKLDKLQLAFTIFKQSVMKPLIRQRTIKNIDYVVRAFLRQHFKDHKDLNIHQVADSLHNFNYQFLDQDDQAQDIQFIESIYEKTQNFDFLIWPSMPKGQQKYQFWESTLILDRAEQLLRMDISGKLQKIRYQRQHFDQQKRTPLLKHPNILTWRNQLIFGLGLQEAEAEPVNQSDEQWIKVSLQQYNQFILQPMIDKNSQLPMPDKQIRIYGNQYDSQVTQIVQALGIQHIFQQKYAPLSEIAKIIQAQDSQFSKVEPLIQGKTLQLAQQIVQGEQIEEPVHEEQILDQVIQEGVTENIINKQQSLPQATSVQTEAIQSQQAVEQNTQQAVQQNNQQITESNEQANQLNSTATIQSEVGIETGSKWDLKVGENESIYEYSQRNKIKGYDFDAFMQLTRLKYKPLFETMYEIKDKQFIKFMLSLESLAEQAHLADNHTLQRKLQQIQKAVKNPLTIGKLAEFELWNFDFVNVTTAEEYIERTDEFKDKFYEFKKYMGKNGPNEIPDNSKKLLSNLDEIVFHRRVTHDFVQELLLTRQELFSQAEAVIQMQPRPQVQELIQWGVFNDQPIAIYFGQKLAMLTNQKISHKLALSAAKYLSHRQQIPQSRVQRCKEALKIVGKINREHIYELNKDYEHITVRKHFRKYLEKRNQELDSSALAYLTRLQPTHKNQDTTFQLKNKISRGNLTV